VLWQSAWVAELNHIIVWSSDRAAGAAHVVDVLGLEQPDDFAGQFLIVNLGNGVSLDYANWNGGELTPQHLAFLVSDDEFDHAIARLQSLGVTYFAEPSLRTPDVINTNDGGRGTYWSGPDGHLLEVITRPYGPETEASGG